MTCAGVRGQRGVHLPAPQPAVPPGKPVCGHTHLPWMPEPFLLGTGEDGPMYVDMSSMPFPVRPVETKALGMRARASFFISRSRMRPLRAQGSAVRGCMVTQVQGFVAWAAPAVPGARGLPCTQRCAYGRQVEHALIHAHRSYSSGMKSNRVWPMDRSCGHGTQ